MDETQSAAPALTDDEIDTGIDFTTDVIADVLSSLLREIGWDSMDPYWEWLAAVVARAKREAAEEIAREIDRLHDTVYQARRVPELDPLRVDTACQAYRDGATIARRIGGDHA